MDDKPKPSPIYEELEAVLGRSLRPEGGVRQVARAAGDSPSRSGARYMMPAMTQGGAITNREVKKQYKMIAFGLEAGKSH